MTVPPPITATVRHWAPVLMRQRTGLRERIALDPMDTAVSIRGVAPEALVPLSIPIGCYANRPERSLDVLAMEGRIWRRLVPAPASDAEEAESHDGEPTLADGLAILAGEVDGTPFRPRIPEGHLLRAHEGDRAIPPRARERASEGFHAVAGDRIRRAAADDVVHDGRSVLVAQDHPVIRIEAGRRAGVAWRGPSAVWRPVFRRDRMEEALAHYAAQGHHDWEVQSNRLSKESFVPRMAAAMEGVELRDDDLRQFVNRAPFVLADSLAGLPAEGDPSAGIEREVFRLCALAAIDAVGSDLGPAVDLLLRASDHAVRRLGRHPPTVRLLRDRAAQIHGYALNVAAPRLSQGPVPDDDAAALVRLAP